MHFTPDQSDFIKYQELTGSACIPMQPAFATIFIEGQGWVLVCWEDSFKNSHILELHNIGHIPNSNVHLISLGKLLANSTKVYDDANSINVTYGDGKILAPFIPGRISVGIYTLEASPLHAKPHLALTNTISYDTVYWKLGHPLRDVLWHAYKHVKNLPDIEISNEVSICPGCAMGKLPNRSLPPNQWYATCTFEFIHSDLKSFPTESYNHHKYIITFVDDFISMAWTTPLCTEDVTLILTRHFLKMVPIQFNAKVQGWMSDAGGEYKSRAFDDLLKGEGICIFQSTSHTSQQNSCAEQFMHTVMDKSEAMWHEACIPDSWWEFTITHATHVYNHTPLQHHNWHTPYEMLHKQQPDIVHLWVFGCAACVHILEDVRINKMAPKSELIVYLGVAPGNTSDFLTMFFWLLYMHSLMSYVIYAMHPPTCVLLQTCTT